MESEIIPQIDLARMAMSNERERPIPIQANENDASPRMSNGFLPWRSASDTQRGEKSAAAGKEWRGWTGQRERRSASSETRGGETYSL